MHLLPTPFLCHNATIAKTRIISQSSTRRKKKPATNSFQRTARATIRNPLAIRSQSQNRPAIKERKRPEYIEPDRGSGAVRVLPLRPDSEIARHRESRVFHNPTPETTPFPPSRSHSNIPTQFNPIEEQAPGTPIRHHQQKTPSQCNPGAIHNHIAIHNPDAIIMQSCHPSSIGARERPENIEPDERIPAGSVLPLHWDSRIVLTAGIQGNPKTQCHSHALNHLALPTTGSMKSAAIL